MAPRAILHMIKDVIIHKSKMASSAALRSVVIVLLGIVLLKVFRIVGPFAG